MKSRRILSLFLCVLMAFSLCVPAVPAYAEEVPASQDGGLCVHHPEHTADCGYVEAGGQPCTHVHDGSCGYVEPVEGQPCTHVHDEGCGYVPAAAEVPCDKNCTDNDGDGVIDHSEDCAYTPAAEAQPCTHVHDGSCGYVEPVEAQPCTHVHDGSCGYAEAGEGQPCKYDVNGCPYCIVSWSWVDEQQVLQQDGSVWGLGLPGVSEENPLTRKALLELLPVKVKAIADDGSEKELELSWDLGTIPEAGAASGDYSITAKLPGDYCLAAGTQALSVLLQLGGAEPLVEPLADIEPEPSFIVVQKLITGLNDEQLQMLKDQLVITVQSNDTVYQLTYGKNDGGIQFQESGNTWAWRINGAIGGNYAVSESGCQPSDLNMPAGSELTASGTGLVSIQNADIGLGIEEETTCSHANWPLYEGCFFAGTLTKNRGSVVITTRSPSASQRQAIEAALLGGVWKSPVYYYSLNSLNIDSSNQDPDYNVPITIIDSSGTTLTTLSYYPNVAYVPGGTPGEIRFSDTSVWQHVAKVAYNTSSVQIGDIQISNAYNQPVTLENALNISKSLTGREWKDSDSFSFTISSESGAPMPENTTVTIKGTDEDKTASFGNITYTKAGTYVYTIRESDSNIPGIDTDSVTYTVTVTVTESAGALSASASYSASKEGAVQDFSYGGAMTFENVYSVGSATEQLVGHKHITGATLKQGQFSFYVESVTVDKGTDGAVTYHNSTDAFNAGVPVPQKGFGTDAAITNGQDASGENVVYFGPLTFTGANAGHSYTYAVKEIKGSAAGYEYDASTKYVTYTVSLQTNEEDNSQYVDVAVTADSSSSDVQTHRYFVFNNSYEPEPCTAAPSAAKTLSGRDMLPGESFGFTLSANSQNPAGGATLPENTIVTVSGGKDGQSMPINFDQIKFTKPGSYQFYITETQWNGEALPSNGTDGMSFGEAVVISYMVTDDNGRLKVSGPTYGSNGSNIANSYRATGDLTGATDLKISKSVVDTGDSPVAWRDYQFSFTLEALENSPLPQGYVTTVTLSEASPNGSFGDITYTQPGEYKYTIRENPSLYHGIQTDGTVYTVTVTVTDNGDGTLNVVPGYSAVKDGSTVEYEYAGAGMSFKNVQDISKAVVGLGGYKTLAGKTLAAGQFKFYIDTVSVYDGSTTTNYSFNDISGSDLAAAKAAGVPLPAKGLGEDDAIANGGSTAAVIYFGSMTYDESHVGKTYTYIIKEVNDSNPGYSYDGNVKTVAVRVEDADPADEKVVVNAVVTKDNSGQGSALFVFSNSYSATGLLDGETYLKVAKELEGRGWLDTDSFSFILTPEENGFPMPASGSERLTLTKSSPSGSFGDISFDQDDAGKTFNYTIRESRGSQSGLVYSQAEYKVTVTVIDNGDGTLKVESAMSKTVDDEGQTLTAAEAVSGNEAKFVNSSDAEISLELKPADIITYMRGDKGYDGSVDGDGNSDKDNTDMPKPMFYLNLVARGEDTALTQAMQSELDKLDMTQVLITASGTEGNPRQWKITLAGKDANGNDLYYIDPVLAGQDPVRVTFTDSNGNVQISDNFTPTSLLHTQYDIALYSGNVSTSTIKVELPGVNDEGSQYEDVPVTMDTSGKGCLTVCHVVESGNPATGVSSAVTAPVSSGNGAAAAPAGTNYTLNKTTVPVDAGSVSLLFDDVYGYGDGSTPYAQKFQNRVDDNLPQLPANTVRYYEAKYLDLVDVNNGNAWVLADQSINVVWGYPSGTDKNTRFRLLHFEDMERQLANVNITADIENWASVTEVSISNTDQGISFNVAPDSSLSKFGPFVLVWERSNPTGNLTVSKTVAGNAGDITKVFNFTVTLSDTGITGTYGDISFTAGVATFSLKHGESKTASGLPANITYTVDETEKNQDGYLTSATGANGTITDGQTATAAFTNTKNVAPPATGSISVTKTVSGNAGNTNKYFSFTVVLGDNTINGWYEQMNFVDGVATFSLKHGETCTAGNLPAGIAYQVYEAEANKNNYHTTSVNASGVVPTQDTATVTFTNYRAYAFGGYVPHTGDESNLGLWIALGAVSLLAVGGVSMFIVAKKKHRNNDAD